MTIGLTIPATVQQEVLTGLCERNQSGEMTWSSEEGSRVRSRVRFLELSGDGLLTDRPKVSGRPVRLPVGEIVQVSFLTNGHRMAFTTRVRGRSRWSGVGSSEVSALVLGVPQEIERVQRRECYRLSVLHLQPVEMRFSSPTDGEGPPDRRFEATLMNISETGCGVTVEKTEAQGVSADDPWDVAFWLPGVEEGLELPGTVRWTNTTAEGDRLLMGVAWQLDPSNREDLLIQRRLSRFVIEQQRQMLRRMRSREEESSG